MRRIAAFALCFSASACVTAPPVADMQNMSPSDLCLLTQQPTLPGSAKAIEAAWRVVSERKLFSDNDLAKVAAHRLEVGMPYYAPQCAWGLPTRVNRTQTEYGMSVQLVYETYLGAGVGRNFRFVYLRDGKVAAVQD